jgi:hypothetical protein
MPPSPASVRWTDHAAAKAALLGIPRTDVEDAVLDLHATRQRNPGSGDWRVDAGRLTVLYNHPDSLDVTAARVVTLWRRR